MFYTAVWCIDNEETFRKKIPLEPLGESIKRFKSDIAFNIVVLEGIELLSTAYLQSLAEYGFTVIDYCREFREIIKRYENLNTWYSRYERNCFLRWIAFKQILRNNSTPFQQFWHLDSDIILHTSLNELAADTKGKTFMLQGCPVLVSVSDWQWFNAYTDNLNSLNADITGYSSVAWQEKEACRKNDQQLVNLSYYRNPIGSDQDLLEYLISGKKILQDDRDSIYHSRFYFVQNALAIKFWHEEQQVQDSQFRLTEDLRITIGPKLVPFVHYQNTFSDFSEVYLFLKKLYIPESSLQKMLAYKIEEDSFKITLLYRAIIKMKYKFSTHKGRKLVIKALMQEKSGNNIAALLNFLIRF